jgi:hypothetical protein
MNSPVPISVMAGKAYLLPDGIYIDDQEVKISDSEDFCGLVISTQSIIATALESAFPSRLGWLRKDETDRFILEPDASPFDQYCQASVRLRTAPQHAETIVGWCLLLDLADRLSSSICIDPDAALAARLIVRKSGHSMSVLRSELESWLNWRACEPPFASDFERSRHAALRPVDPYRNRTKVIVPWVNELGLFSAIDYVSVHGGDIVLDKASQTAMVPVNSCNTCVYGAADIELLPALQRAGASFFECNKGIQPLKFRAYAKAETIVLRGIERPSGEVEVTK